MNKNQYTLWQVIGGWFAASAVEICFQNFSTGFVVALLLDYENPKGRETSIHVELGMS